MLDLEIKKIVVSTHYLTYGPSQALKDFLVKKKIKELVYISHPLEMGTAVDSVSFLEKFKAGNLSKEEKKKRREKRFSIKCFRDLFLTFRWVYKEKGKFDLFVGSDNLNAFIGIILKKLGKVKRVVYYTIDYFPNRFNNKFLNFIYYNVDRFCVKYSDETWILTPTVIEARENKMKMAREKYNKQFVVPIGVWFNRIQRKAFNDINKQQIVFVGHLVKHMGVDLVIKSIPLIVEQIPNLQFLLIGGGQEYENLKKLAQDLQVEKYIEFTGWVKDRVELENMMLDTAIGIAPFNTEILDEKVYNADPAKIKDYMLLGMPVILTDAPPIAKKLQEKQCGLIINYTKESLAKAVISLLTDQEKLKKYRKNATEFISDFDWDILFTENLNRILEN